jgi:NAD+ kinase
MKNQIALSRGFRRVAVVLKQTVVDDVRETKDERMIALMAIGDISVAGAEQANIEHHETADHVLAFLSQRGLEVQVFERDELPQLLEGFDLIITIGGDGTVLTTACHVLETPILGIKSAESSLAHHCLADWVTFPGIIDAILSGQLRPHRLLRLTANIHRMVIENRTAWLNPVPVAVPVLNDILVHDASPGATSRFILQVRGVSERQDGSGLWIGTAAGSTGALRSAGGKFMELTAQKFEFVSREACIKPDRERFKLLRRVLRQNEEITVISRMRRGMLFVDGQYRTFDFPIGDRLIIKRNPQDLVAFVNPKLNDRYSYFFGVYRPW